MSELKRNDWVRVLRTDYPEIILAGSIVQVDKVEYDGDADLYTADRSSSWFFCASEFERWTPKVGERVRINCRAGVSTPGEGVVKNVSGVSILIDHVDGWEKGHDGDVPDGNTRHWWYDADDLAPIPAATVAAPAQPPAPIAITVGKIYRDADGNKVGPMVKSTNWPYSHPFYVEGELGRWNAYGKCSDKVKDRRANLVAEWSIEAGKFYKTRDGQKIGPMKPWNEFWIADIDKTRRLFESTGRHRFGVRNYDLIAEWVEPVPAKVNVAATVDYLADEYGSGAKPTFKVGDIVMSTGNEDTKYVVDGVHNGEVKVTSIEAAGNRGVCFGWFKESQFYHVAADVPPAKFKVGDKMRHKEVQGCDNGTILKIVDDKWAQINYEGKWIATDHFDTIELIDGDNTPKAKFKVGDRVRCTVGFGFATVVEVAADGRYRVRWDNGGEGAVWLSDKNFDLAPTPWAGHAPRKPTAIVALIEDGKPKPNSRPYVHTTIDSANKEATRLAGVHKGKSFGVYVLTGEPISVPKPVYDHKWQTLAANGNKIAAIRELRGITGMGLKPAKDAVEYFVAAA